jgi:hypothetical protein
VRTGLTRLAWRDDQPDLGRGRRLDARGRGILDRRHVAGMMQYRSKSGSRGEELFVKERLDPSCS